jgi:hypothetical protein
MGDEIIADGTLDRLLFSPVLRLLRAWIPLLDCQRVEDSTRSYSRNNNFLPIESRVQVEAVVTALDTGS